MLSGKRIGVHTYTAYIYLQLRNIEKKMASNNESCDAPTKEIDIYRDTPLRLLGYANEVGEAFRALVSVKFVIGTYGVASAYVLADTYDKASKVRLIHK